MTLTFERAEMGDEPIVRALQDEAIAWLATKGSDQWQPSAQRDRDGRRPSERDLRDGLDRGEVYLVRDGGEVVGTITLDDYADPEFWADDDPASALYVHRMIISRAAAGRDLGAAMLDWASDQAARADRKWLRLDAWRTNTALHDYYRRRGFTHLRTVGGPWRGSGALFQRLAAPRIEKREP